MKKTGILCLFLIVALVGFGQVSDAAGRGKGCGQGKGKDKGSGGGGCESILAEQFESLPVQELDDAERATLVRIREDEKLARDVCTTLGEKWELPIFGNIAGAEQRHMDHVALLITRYEIKDPVIDDGTGALTDPELGELYTRLVATGQKSMEDALRVGATIEDLDLADLQKMSDASDNQDVHLIANNLTKGSRNHLRAFTKVLDRRGYDAYTAQFLTQEKVDQIIAAEHERHVVYDEKGEAIAEVGGGGGCGKAKGKGQGRGKCKGQGQGKGNCARNQT